MIQTRSLKLLLADSEGLIDFAWQLHSKKGMHFTTASDASWTVNYSCWIVNDKKNSDNNSRLFIVA